MDTLFQRFPHLSQEVFDLVDNLCLAKCQKVSLPWYEFLQKQKFHEIRVIKSVIEQFHDVGANCYNSKYHGFPKAVGQFFYKARIQDSSPLHVVAGFGNLTLFTMIEKICPLQYSEDISSSLKPIHIAAIWGQL